VQVPQPKPVPGGNVEHVTQQVHDTVALAVPPAQPVVDQTVATVQQTCGLIGGCP
jgi:hypothetical protein